MKTIFMPEELKNKWVKALRSGMYEQGRKALKTKDGKYCCLGVLQMVCTGRVQTENKKPVGLPTPNWLKLKNINFKSKGGNLRRSDPFLDSLNRRAAEANDAGLTFDQIADAIEKAYGGETPNT